MPDTEISHPPSQCTGIDTKQFCCPVGSVNFTVGHFQHTFWYTSTSPCQDSKACQAFEKCWVTQFTYIFLPTTGSQISAALPRSGSALVPPVWTDNQVWPISACWLSHPASVAYWYFTSDGSIWMPILGQFSTPVNKQTASPTTHKWYVTHNTNQVIYHLQIKSNTTYHRLTKAAPKKDNNKYAKLP